MLVPLEFIPREELNKVKTTDYCNNRLAVILSSYLLDKIYYGNAIIIYE